MISGVPTSAVTRWAICATAEALLRSTGYAVAEPGPIELATRSSSPSRRATRSTRAPAWASARAVAAPIPLEAPVTSAVLPRGFMAPPHRLGSVYDGDGRYVLRPSPRP